MPLTLCLLLALAPPAELAAILEPLRAAAGLPALGAAITSRDKLLALSVVGARKLGDATPAGPADQWHLGSCTKAMTATLAGLLVDDGRLTWETTLAEVFPELTDAGRPEYRSVTLAQLLAHRGGFAGPEGSLPEGFGPAERTRPLPEQRRLYVRAALRAAPAAPPGTRTIYSNVGYALVGALLERLTGELFEDLLRRRLFAPLGLTSAGFGPAGTPGRVDQPWQHLWRDGVLLPLEPRPAHDNPDVLAPAGKVHASLADWAAFVRLHLAAGDLVSPATLTALHTPRFDDEWASGWYVAPRDWAGGQALHHNGSNTQNYCVVWAAPARGFAVLVATNAAPPGVETVIDRVAWTLIQRQLAR